MLKRIGDLLRLDDAADEQEVIDGITKGVNFRGAKLWILVLAVFVASLGLNTNSAAVIIGAMLISPLMGPIIGMGLGVGIYDFDLLRRSFRNFIIATVFSVLTATIYFLITPLAEAQSELLARTSPTIYDVLIALCGGLAGIIALSSKSQRTGNVIPGVAIATALMPPLCTVGFGIATANWAYAAGALYLFVINTIFIAFATLIGTIFIMKFQKKVYLDRAKEKKVKRTIYTIAFLTIIPAILLTVKMVGENFFERQVSRFVQQEFHYSMTHVISYDADFEKREINVVLIGNEVDSAALQVARDRLSLYKLEDVKLNVIQGSQSAANGAFDEKLLTGANELKKAEAVITQQQVRISELEQRIASFTKASELAPQLLREVKVLCPQVEEMSVARGMTAQGDSTSVGTFVIIDSSTSISSQDQERILLWFKERTGEKDVKVFTELKVKK